MSRAALVALILTAAPALAQEVPRIGLGGGYSVAAPDGGGWIAEGEGAQRTFLRVFGPDSHTLVMLTAVGPSGITREQVLAIGKADPGDAANLLVRTLSGFATNAWKMNAAGLESGRFAVLDKKEELAKGFASGLFCAESRIRARDRGAPGEPVLRYVGYTCVSIARLMDAVHVSYSERGAEADLSDAALQAGEVFARSLRSD